MAPKQRKGPKTAHDHTGETARLGEWCRTIAGYMADSSSDPFVDCALVRTIDAAVEKSDVRGLQMISKNLAEWGASPGSKERADLEALLTTRVGVGLKRGVSSAQARLRTILDSGLIGSEEDYRLVLAEVESNYANERNDDRLERMNELLAKYEGGED